MNAKLAKGKKSRGVEKAPGKERAPTVPVPGVPRTEERARTATFAKIVDAMIDPVFVLDLEGRCVFANRAYSQMFGMGPEDFVGKSIMETPGVEKQKPEVVEKFMPLIRETIEQGSAGPVEIVLVAMDGREIPLSLAGGVIKDAQGNPTHIVAVLRDITEHKKIGEKLRLFSQSVESAIDGIAIGSPEGKIIYVNEAFVRMFGYSREELIGKEIAFIYPEDQVPKLEEALKATLEGGWTGELVAKRKDGKLFPMLVSSSRVLDDEGKVIAHMASHRDITERKQAEERIKHLNVVLRAISNVDQLITKENDRDKLLQGICDNLVATRGYFNTWIALLNESGELVTTAEAGLGKKFLPMVERLKRSVLTDCGRKALRQSDVVVTEDPVSTCTDCPLSTNYGGRGAMTVRLKHGEKVYGMISASIPRDLATDKEEQALFKEVVADIAFALYNIELKEEHKRAEEALRESEQRYRQLFEGIGDAVMVYGPQGRFLDCNKATLQRLGYSREEFLRLGGADIVHPDFHLKMKDNLKRIWAGETNVVESAHRCKDGRVIPVGAHVSRIKYRGKPAILAVVRDMTELKKAEEENLKAAANKQRMEELEKFAKIAVGRELKMVELKEQIKALELRIEGITEKG